MSPHHPTVEIHVPCGRLRDTPIRGDRSTGRGAEPLTELGIPEETSDRLSQRLGIVWWNKQSVPAILHDFGNAPDARGDDRSPERHRFEEDERQAFDSGGKNHDL